MFCRARASAIFWGACRSRQTPDNHAGEALQARDQPGTEFLLILLHRLHGSVELESPTGKPRKIALELRTHCCPQPREVVNRTQSGSLPLVGLRSGLKISGSNLVCRTDLVRLQLIQQLQPPPQHPLVRSEKLVG